jgi:hypothetical protein
MSNTEVKWIAPAPFWESVANFGTIDREASRQPALLRFASDNFMNDFVAVLESNPEQLREFKARRETWRGPETTPVVEPVEHLPKLVQKLQRSRRIAEKTTRRAAVSRPAASRRPLKLYQPAHQRYYLISAALVCQIAGQPDRRLDPSAQERVSFVVRKVVPPAETSIVDNTESTWTEYAFVNNSWLKLEGENLHTLVASEEQNPLFAVTYTQDDARRRRVLAGLVPVGKREAYIAAPRRNKDQQIVLDPGQDPPPDPRTLLFMANVTEPWKRLVERAAAIHKMQTASSATDDPTTGADLARSMKESREQLQTASWYVLLDFAKLLRQYIPDVWNSILEPGSTSSLSGGEPALFNELVNTTIDSEYAKELVADTEYEPSDVIRNLRDALKQFQDAVPFSQSDPPLPNSIEDHLESIVTPYDRSLDPSASNWPDFLFPLADPDPKNKGPLPPPTLPVTADRTALEVPLEQIDHLADLIEDALPAAPGEKTPPPLLAAQPVMGIDAQAFFVIRCVFERPNCAPLQSSVVSDATEPFAMAGFFDPDAPARPVRINLPVDTTAAGLRKFDKNTAFMISDVLCGQIDRAKGLGLGDLVRSVLPFPFHKDLDIPDTGPCNEDGVSFGMICSLSIPIITICALILLMIIVSLLDIIFHWIPFFIMCLPFPKFSGKQAAA